MSGTAPLRRFWGGLSVASGLGPGLTHSSTDAAPGYLQGAAHLARPYVVDLDERGAVTTLLFGARRAVPPACGAVIRRPFRVSGLLEFGHERPPRLGTEGQRPAVAVGGVADENHAVVSDFDTLSAVAAAVRRLTPVPADFDARAAVAAAV